ncbi:CDC14A [Scenedesmus sp. PABB004]|nr:CDC14A [Scenedesmus sp. PABB004]
MRGAAGREPCARGGGGRSAGAARSRLAAVVPAAAAAAAAVGPAAAAGAGAAAAGPPAAAASGAGPAAAPAPRAGAGEVLYFAYGSNMCPRVLTGRRRVRPSGAWPCSLPDHELSVAGMMGLPFSEPGMATILQRPQQQPQQHQQRRQPPPGGQPCVHGVLFRISAAEWERVKATEGVGSSAVGYQVVPVRCRLYAGGEASALTLRGAPASLHAAGRRVQPSARYLGLVREGAAHHGLEPSYQAWLASLQSFDAPQSTRLVGTVATGGVLLAAAAPALPAYFAGRALGLVPHGSGGGGGGPLPFLASFLTGAQAVTWAVHDAALAPLLGSGAASERGRATPSRPSRTSPPRVASRRLAAARSPSASIRTWAASRTAAGGARCPGARGAGSHQGAGAGATAAAAAAAGEQQRRQQQRRRRRRAHAARAAASAAPPPAPGPSRLRPAAAAAAPPGSSQRRRRPRVRRGPDRAAAMGGRAAWKGPYVAVSLLRDVIAMARAHPEWWGRTRFQGAPAPAIIRTQSRASVILPDFLRCVFFVHNGSKRMARIEVSENMVGHKFGEFAPTRKFPQHKDKKKNCGCGRRAAGPARDAGARGLPKPAGAPGRPTPSALAERSGAMDDEFSQAAEIVPGRFYVAFLKHADSPAYSPTAAAGLCYSIDAELLYEPFYADFGPLNLGKTYRFCEHTRALLQARAPHAPHAEAERLGKRLYLCTGPAPQAWANAAVLVGAFEVLYLNRSPEEAYAPLACQAPYMPFRDASCGVPTFNLQPIDCIRGLAKARDVGFIDASGGSWRFDLDEYEHYEQVENGDLNWIVPGKLVAFSGPAARPTDYVGFRAMVPEDYWDYFGRRGVRGVVRLNKKVYDRKRFLDGGFAHTELYFPDGSCPSQDILLRFLALAEAAPGALAVHCKAGLGRTGVLICSYIMKHYGFTAEEVIGYIRICRPGSVIGPQQGFIKDIQRIMWMEGEAYRALHGPHPPPLMWGVTPAAATIAAAAAAPRAAASPASSAGSAAACARADAGGKGGAALPMHINLVVDATAQQVTSRGEAAPCIGKTLSDLSLRQLQDRLGERSGSASSSSSASGASRPAAPRTPSAGARSGAAQAAAAAAAAAVPGRGVAPQRLFGSPAAAPASSSSSGPLTGGLVGASAPSRPSSGQSLLTRSAAAASAAGAAAASAARERALLASSITSLRATLHSDAVAAAARARAQPDSAVSQGSDFAGSGWRTPLTPAPAAGSSRPSSVARVLAPNGQPRKLPAAALAAALAAPAPAAAAKGSTPLTPQQQALAAARLSAYYSGSS